MRTTPCSDFGPAEVSRTHDVSDLMLGFRTGGRPARALHRLGWDPRISKLGLVCACIVAVAGVTDLADAAPGSWAGPRGASRGKHGNPRPSGPLATSQKLAASPAGCPGPTPALPKNLDVEPVGTATVANPAPFNTPTASTAESGAAGRRPRLPIVFTGNLVFIPEVYDSVLRSSGWEDAPAEEDARAAWIEETIEGFLFASGYELASVSARYNGEKYELVIDEGRLDKIIFRNVDPWMTVQLIFMLDLPEKVFNRDLVERRLRRVQEKLAVEEVGYEVLPVDEPNHRRLQIRDPGIIEGLTLLRPGEPHELRIFLETRDRQAGLQLGLDVQPPDGLVVGGSYLAPSVFADRDRLDVYGRLGVRVTDVGRIPGNRVGLSQAGGGLRWSTPSIGDLIRLTARAEASLEARLREDLELVNYFFAPIQGALGVSLERKRFTIAVEGGVEFRNFFGAREEEDTDAPILEATEGDNLRGLVRSEFIYVFNPDRLRRDRPHHAGLSGRFLWPVADATGDIYELRLFYENTLSVGFDEFRYAVRAASLGGNVPFYSEIPMGEGFLRSAFQGTVFARQLAAINLEYRFSLSRDTLKLGLFNDVAVYEELDELREGRGAAAINNAGVGLHILLLDAFQVNGYLGVGLRTDGETDFGFSVDVTQAF